ncbi:two-component response regulator ORR24-like [Lycium ferocissimum]|uniref:two-component response regulator ORR24-like n=1 Tax=Lycium ferocissimum TaxID=112874 RepID=UPI002814B2B1|nr:two-component response regulator ORR24-like [Lycium ferocissimum]
MSEEENLQTVEGIDKPMTTPYYGMIKHIIRVMLIDHDKEFVDERVDLLKSYGYKVTTVDTALAAMSILSKGKEKIDVIIFNVHSPDRLSFQLLAQAVALNVVSLFICDEDNDLLAMKALNIGACIYLKKPLDEEIVEDLWQFVLRRTIQKEKVRERLEENGDKMNVDDIGNNNIVGDEVQAGEKSIPNIENQSNNIEAENDVVSNGKYKQGRKRNRKSTKEINEGESQSSAINKSVRQKLRIEWTVDLHTKFMKAVQQLGEGSCYPKEILEMMNVPGLTRMQVASHLQKCRNDNWRVPKKRKSIRHSSGQGSSSGSKQISRLRKFGTMPRLKTNVTNLQQQQCNLEIRRVPKFPFQPHNINNIFERGESSIQQQVYHPQLNVGPTYLSIDSLFNNPFLSAQNNVGGGLQQQQHSPLFEMLGPQGLQRPINGSTNYRPELVFNDGYYHAQNDYKLNVNAYNIKTYSNSAMISDADVGNATIINGLGVTNANFQQYMGEQNMSDPSNIVAASYPSDMEGGDSSKNENYDVYFDYNNTDYLFQNLKLSSDNLPNDQDSEFDQVYSSDQVAPTPSVEFSGITNFPRDLSI